MTTAIHTMMKSLVNVRVCVQRNEDAASVLCGPKKYFPPLFMISFSTV